MFGVASPQVEPTSQTFHYKGKARQEHSENQGYSYHPNSFPPLGSSAAGTALPFNPQSFTANAPHMRKKSVKHLECWYFHVCHYCKFDEKDCKYSHKPTRLLARPPIRTGPGELLTLRSPCTTHVTLADSNATGPARAGRNLNRHLSVKSPGIQQVQLPSATENPSPEAIKSLKNAVSCWESQWTSRSAWSKTRSWN